MDRSTSRSGGVSLMTVLLVLFVTLKLCGVLTWAWPAVLIPLWAMLSVWSLVGAVKLAYVALLYAAWRRRQALTPAPRRVVVAFVAR